MKLNCPVCSYPFDLDLEPYSCVFCGSGFWYTNYDYYYDEIYVYRDYACDDKVLVDNFPIKNINKMDFSKIKL